MVIVQQPRERWGVGGVRVGVAVETAGRAGITTACVPTVLHEAAAVIMNVCKQQQISVGNVVGGWVVFVSRTLAEFSLLCVRVQVHRG